MCQFTQPLAIGDVEAVDPAPGSPVGGSLRLNFGNTEITASTAITVDSTSIIYAGYTDSNRYFMGAVRTNLEMLEIIISSFLFNFQFHITSISSSLGPERAFYTNSMPSPVRQLQWKSGLDYVYVATDTSVSDILQ